MSKYMRFVMPHLALGYIAAASVPASRNVMNAASAASGGRPDDDVRYSSRAYACPKCSGPVIRVRRRYIDRLISLVTPVHRYRCHAKGLGCGWEGNLRLHSDIQH